MECIVGSVDLNLCYITLHNDLLEHSLGYCEYWRLKILIFIKELLFPPLFYRNARTVYVQSESADELVRWDWQSEWANERISKWDSGEVGRLPNLCMRKWLELVVNMTYDCLVWCLLAEVDSDKGRNLYEWRSVLFTACGERLQESLLTTSSYCAIVFKSLVLHHPDLLLRHVWTRHWNYLFYLVAFPVVQFDGNAPFLYFIQSAWWYFCTFRKCRFCNVDETVPKIKGDNCYFILKQIVQHRFGPHIFSVSVIRCPLLRQYL